MRFIGEAQLPPALADWFRDQRGGARHVYDLLPPEAKDGAIWDLALRDGYILVTKDEDFAEWSRLREPAPAVLWLRIGNVKRALLRPRLQPLLPGLIQRFASGETLIEVH